MDTDEEMFPEERSVDRTSTRHLARHDGESSSRLILQNLLSGLDLNTAGWVLLALRHRPGPGYNGGSDSQDRPPGTCTGLRRLDGGAAFAV